MSEQIDKSTMLSVRTAALVKKHGFRIQKKYGQNFLTSERVLRDIVSAADLHGEEYVLEIGPGTGNLTMLLADQAAHVTAVEIDEQVIPLLQENLEGCDNVNIVRQDILKTDLGELLDSEGAGKTWQAVANLPYYITTPIIMKLLESPIPLRSVTVMVQKEVAQRLQAPAGSKECGAISLAVQYYAEPEIVTDVPAGCFYPPPEVDSAVIHLKKHANPPVETKDAALMFKLIHAAFNQRRKTLANALAGAGNLGFTKEQVYEALRVLNIREDVRGEKLGLAEYAALTDALSERA